MRCGSDGYHRHIPQVHTLATGHRKSFLELPADLASKLQEVKIHTKPPIILLGGLKLADYKATYVRPSESALRQSKGRSGRDRAFMPFDSEIPSHLDLCSF